MSDKKKRLVKAIMDRTGRTMAGAHNLLRNARDGDPSAQKLVAEVKAAMTCACCERGGQYNGFGSGPLAFVCPKHCSCHD
jgi:hypothetical protein